MSDNDYLPYLAAAIKTTIDEYHRTHPDTTNDQTLATLVKVADLYMPHDEAMKYLRSLAKDCPELTGYAKAGDGIPGPVAGELLPENIPGPEQGEIKDSNPASCCVI